MRKTLATLVSISLITFAIWLGGCSTSSNDTNTGAGGTTASPSVSPSAAYTGSPGAQASPTITITPTGPGTPTGSPSGTRPVATPTRQP